MTGDYSVKEGSGKSKNGKGTRTVSRAGPIGEGEMSEYRTERKTEGFEPVKAPADNPDGFTVEIRYTAPWYRYSKMPLPRARAVHVLIETIKIGVLCLGYVRYSGCNLYSYSGRLAVSALAPELFCMLGIVFFLFSTERLHLPRYREIKNLICIGSGVSGVVLGISSVGCCVYIAAAKPETVGEELLTLISYLFAAAMCIILSLLQREKCYEKIDNNQGENQG